MRVKAPDPPASRGSILVESGELLATTAYPGDQHVLRIHAPRIAERSRAGQFVHLRCAQELMMRRPMSIMRAAPEGGWIEILFKAHGLGTELLAQQRVGGQIPLLGPIGRPFEQQSYRRRSLLIGGGVGIPPMVFLAEHMRTHAARPFVIMGSEVPFPFTLKPSQILVPGIPNDVIATMPLMEDWGIACRLASQQSYAGCFDGLVTDLAEHWILQQKDAHDDDIDIFACGPTAMLKAVATLAARHSLGCQVSLEEYMACAVGGCAGCVVEVRTTSGPAMRRVCVDGPVFEAGDVVFT